MIHDDRDALIRLALAPAPDVAAPADLGDAIYREVLATPQRRGFVRLGRLGWLPTPSPLVLTLALLAVLAAALVVAGLLRPEPPILSMHHGGPDRVGVMPGPGPAGVPVAVWQAELDGAVPFTAMPLPAGDRVFVGDTGGNLTALDALTGAVLWEVDVGGSMYGTPVDVDDLAVVATDAGDVVATTAAGEEAWRRPLDAGALVASLLVADGVIYAGTEDGHLVALSPDDGRERWRVEVAGMVNRAPAFADGVVYVATAAGWLSAIDVATREPRWSVELGGVLGTPMVAGGLIYTGRGTEGDDPLDLVALDVADGAVRWTFAPTPGGQAAPGAVAHGRVYAGSADGNLYALDAASGAPVWMAGVGGRLATLATVVGDAVYVSSTAGSVHALDAASGRELWVVGVGAGEPTMPVVVDGRIYVGTDLGLVQAFADPP